MSENERFDEHIPPGEGVPMERVAYGSGHYVKEVGYEQAKFVASAMDHAALLDWESTDHDKQTACAVAIAEATRFILGVRGFIAIGAENEPRDEPGEGTTAEMIADMQNAPPGSTFLETEPPDQQTGQQRDTSVE